MNDRIPDIIISTLKELGYDTHYPELREPTSATPLFGPQGTLDSLALVMLVTEVERRITEVFRKKIVIADERAMSQRRSPFRSVQSLAEYIQKLISE